MQLMFRTTGQWLTALCLILLAACATFAKAENGCAPEVSRLISAQGRVDAYLATANQWTSAQQGQPYCGDDKVRTGALSRAVLDRKSVV